MPVHGRARGTRDLQGPRMRRLMLKQMSPHAPSVIPDHQVRQRGRRTAPGELVESWESPNPGYYDFTRKVQRLLSFKKNITI